MQQRGELRLSELLTPLLVLVYKLALDWSYAVVLYPNYSYAGFRLLPTAVTVATGYLLLLPVLVALPMRIERPSSFFLFLLVLIGCVPVLTIYSHAGGSLHYALLTAVFWCAVCVGTRCLPLVRLPRLPNRIRRALFYGVLLLLGVYCLYFVGRSFGFSLSLRLDDVYEQRAAYKLSGIPLSGYLFNWTANVAAPAGIMYFFLRKKYMWCLPLLYVQLLLFSATGMKTMLFGLALTAAVLVLCKLKSKLFWIGAGAAGGVALTALFYQTGGSIMPYSLFVRRLLLLPAKISFHYYDFFSRHPPLRLSHSFLGVLGDYPYEGTPTALLIGRLYMYEETYANTGVVGDAYMNFGVFGVLAFALVLILVLSLIDWVGNGRPLPLTLSCFAVFSIIFTNAALFTALLSHGALFGLFLLWICPDIPTDPAPSRAAVQPVLSSKRRCL